MLGMIWDVLETSAFLRWFLPGVLVGVVLVVAGYLLGLAAVHEYGLPIVLGAGVASVVLRLAVWVARR